MEYASNSIMNFIWSRKRKVHISDSNELYRFLLGMNDSGLLEKEKIEKIIQFYDFNYYSWDLETFESYLKEYKAHSSNISERDFCDKCLRLFNLSLLEGESSEYIFIDSIYEE